MMRLLVVGLTRKEQPRGNRPLSKLHHLFFSENKKKLLPCPPTSHEPRGRLAAFPQTADRDPLAWNSAAAQF
jgi:hypothetical protein